VRLDRDDGHVVAVTILMAGVRGLGSSARARRRSRGQGLMEFALVLPLIVFIVTGAVDLGRAVFAYNTLAAAARHGARVAAVNQLAPADTVTSCNEDMPIEDVTVPHWSAKACTAASAFTLGVSPADVTLTYSDPPDDALLDCSTVLHPNCLVTVSVTAVWHPITPVISSMVGSIDLSAQSEIPLERVFP
jgi:Flp pilus assembly protein TadG